MAVRELINSAHWAERNIREDYQTLMRAIATAHTTDDAYELADLCGEFARLFTQAQDAARARHTQLNNAKQWRR